MAFEKKTWLARQGTKLNRFINTLTGTAIELVNSPTEVTQAGDSFTIENMNGLENRIDTAVAGLETNKENVANKGIANGYCPLDSGGKVALQNLPSTLLKYQGVWNASTNTPTLINPDTSKVGYVYNVSVAGTQFGIGFKLGDWLIYNASGIPEKSDNSDDVVSVNGRTGAVTGLAENSAVVHNTGNETIAGDKTFTGITNLSSSTIDSIADTVVVRGRNYLINSNVPQTLTNDGSSAKILFAYYYASTSMGEFLDGKTVTVSFDYTCNITSGDCSCFLYYWVGLRTFTSANNGSGKFTVIKTLSDVVHENDKAIWLNGTFVGTVTITNIKVEIGNKATPYSPAPEDVALNVATVHNTGNETVAGNKTFTGKVIAQSIPRTTYETVLSATTNSITIANRNQNGETGAVNCKRFVINIKVPTSAAVSGTTYNINAQFNGITTSTYKFNGYNGMTTYIPLGIMAELDSQLEARGSIKQSKLSVFSQYDWHDTALPGGGIFSGFNTGNISAISSITIYLASAQVFPVGTIISLEETEIL